jgi:hypothetical protein
MPLSYAGHTKNCVRCNRENCIPVPGEPGAYGRWSGLAVPFGILGAAAALLALAWWFDLPDRWHGLWQ